MILYTGCVLNLVQPKACSVAFDTTLKNLSTNTNVAQDEWVNVYTMLQNLKFTI